jgi:prepilin-type N-terminal cleavage/methylation domain-containing protein
MFNLKWRNKIGGFTLIELLVVISIISLLSSVVMASLNSAKTKAQEAAIKADLLSIKTQAELAYSKTGDYSTVATDIAPIIDHINKNGGTAAIYVSDYYGYTLNKHYAVSAKLNSDTSKKWSISDQFNLTVWDSVELNLNNINWSNSKNSCEATGKRLPTIEELKALWIAYTGKPNDFSSSHYWSSNEDLDDPRIAFLINVAGGIGNNFKTSTTQSARCVR